MPESDRPLLHVHLLPALIPPGALRGGVAVVIDVLRATTVMARALASGCAAIVPCAEIDEARAVAAGLPAGTALLAGERRGVPIEGFDLGNSPGDFTPNVCRGKTLVMTTTNGTRAILASREADEVLVAAFVNLGATAAYLNATRGRSVHLVCAGTDGLVSLEDSFLAGALGQRLLGPRLGSGNDAAEIAVGYWAGALEWNRDGEGMDPAALLKFLSLGRGGRRVRELGLTADLAAAARVDTDPLVARLNPPDGRIIKVNVDGANSARL